jgi:hypothetical protein
LRWRVEGQRPPSPLFSRTKNSNVLIRVCATYAGEGRKTRTKQRMNKLFLSATGDSAAFFRPSIV